MITQEALFNRSSNVHGFSPIEKKYIYTEEDNVIGVFEDLSKKFAKTLFVINIIFGEKKNYDKSSYQKMFDLLLNYDKHLAKPLNFKKIVGQNLTEQNTKDLKKNHLAEFDYILLPLLSRNYSSMVSVTNKSYVFFEGKIVATYKKRTLGKRDLPLYSKHARTK